MTVARLRREMSNAEFVAWDIYYQREVQIREMAEKKASASSGN